MSDLNAFLSEQLGQQAAPQQALAAAAAPTTPANPATPAAPASRQIDASLDGILGFFQQIDDPVVRMFAQGMVEAQLSKPVAQGGLGFRVKFPDPADVEMQALDRQLAINRKREALAKDDVLEAKVGLLALDPRALEVYGASGKDLNQFIESDPDGFVAMVNKELSLERPMSRSTLVRAGQDIVLTQAERIDQQNTKLKRSVDTAKLQTEAAKVVPDALSREAEALKSQFEGGFPSKPNLGTGPLSQIDETAESRVFAALGVATVEDSAFEPAQAARGFLQENGANIADQLESLGKDKFKRLIVTKGDRGVDDEAVFFLSSTLMKMAQAQGTTVGDVMQQIGLGEYAGISMDSYFEAAAKIAIAGGAPADPESDEFKKAVDRVFEVGGGAGFRDQIARELRVEEEFSGGR